MKEEYFLPRYANFPLKVDRWLKGSFDVQVFTLDVFTLSRLYCICYRLPIAKIPEPMNDTVNGGE